MNKYQKFYYNWIIHSLSEDFIIIYEISRHFFFFIHFFLSFLL